MFEGSESGPLLSGGGDRGWGSLEYVLWWINGAKAPALVTTSPDGTPFNTAGILGASTTTVLIGGDVANYDGLSGVRLSAGYWIDDQHEFGIEARGFLTAVQAARASAGSDANGSPILARPIVDTGTNAQSTLLIAFPGAFRGTIDVTSRSRVGGAEINFLERLPCRSLASLNALFGVRFVQFREDLDINQNSTLLAAGLVGFQGTPITAPNGVLIRDTFNGRNEFYGFQGGLSGTYEIGNLSVDVSGKLAVGQTQQRLDIVGSTQLVTPNGVNGTATGGLLALPTNSGRLVHRQFSVMPEAELRFNYRFSSNLAVFLGYDFLYWSEVVRPGEQIDRTVSTTQQPTSLTFNPLAGPSRPTSLFNSNNRGLTVQGLTFGVTLHY